MCSLRATFREKILAPSGSSERGGSFDSLMLFMIAVSIVFLFSRYGCTICATRRVCFGRSGRDVLLPLFCLAKAPTHVVLGLLLSRTRKNVVGCPFFYHMSLEKKHGSLSHASGLLHAYYASLES